jgi:hypothetical protein
MQKLAAAKNLVVSRMQESVLCGHLPFFSLHLALAFDWRDHHDATIRLFHHFTTYPLLQKNAFYIIHPCPSPQHGQRTE